jgi:hypothetical protein
MLKCILKKGSINTQDQISHVRYVMKYNIDQDLATFMGLCMRPLKNILHYLARRKQNMAVLIKLPC